LAISKTKVPIAVPDISEEDALAVYSAVKSGWISGRGKRVVDFEREFGSWLGIKHTIACSSGTSALHLALAAIGVGPKDEVVIPAFSMAAIPFAVAYTGAKIVLVDSEWATWNMDTSDLEEKITTNTRAIITMHTYGHPVKLDPVLDICRQKGIILIEDAAEAHGAEYRGKKVGTLGDIGCFSFFSNKIITTGEGGAVVTSNNEIAEMIRTLKDMAFSKDLSKKFLHDHIGFNYRMTNMQAALGSSQLHRIDDFIEIRRKNAKLYNSLLSNVEGIVASPEARWAKNVYWMYSILVTPSYGLNRDELMTKLSEQGIETRPFFVPVHQQPIFSGSYGNEKYGIAEMLSQTGLNLPSGNTLTEDQIRYVALAIRSLARQ
jgi:perosamine synthetase